MPYSVGGKGTNGCSGFPVVDEGGKVVGCHPTKAKAVNHMQALYANVPDASKADTPMDVAYNPIVTDPEPASPSSHINPNAGMRKPQYMTNFGRQIGGGIHDKRMVDIWTVKADNEIIPTATYQEQQGNYGQQTDSKCTYDGCGCETCKALNVCCDLCPVCQSNEMKNDCCPDLNKKDPCWEGYVQRGMKEKGGKMVPNCVPVNKSDSPEQQPQEQPTQKESWFNFRDVRPTKNTYRVEE